MKSLVVDFIEETKYPCLKVYEDTGRVILFTGKNTGVIVHDEDYVNGFMGEYSDGWVENNFVMFNGKIELSNK